MSLPLQFFGFILWAALVFVAALTGTIASMNADSFYAELIRPSWAPPSWLFGPMWTTLYCLMAVSVWLVWREGRRTGARTTGALVVFVVQLALNALWSWLFFAWRLGAWAFAEVAVLWVLILVTLVMFWRVKRLAGILLIPYIAWVTLATALTYSVWQANPHLLG